MNGQLTFIISIICLAAVTRALSVGERSYPTSEDSGRRRKDPMPEGQRPRGVTPHPSSGAAAESARLRRRRNGQEELPDVRGQGGQPREDTQRRRSGEAAGRRYPTPLSPRSGAAGGRSYPTPLGPRPGAGRREEQPHTVAARAQEGLEELSHVESQEGRR